MAEAPQDNRSWTERTGNWLRENVTDRFHGLFWKANDTMAENIDRATGGNIKKDSAKQLIPIAAGAAAVGAGLVFIEPIKAGARMVFGGVKNVVTGFGYFEKIPLVGGLFSGAGKVIDTIGEYAGYAVPAIGGLLGFSLMSGRNDAPASNATLTPFYHTGRVADPPEMVTTTVVNPATQVAQAREQTPLRPAPVAPIPATSQQVVDALKVLPKEPVATALPQARELREQASAANMKAVDKALEDYMGFINQRYENTRAWIDEAEKFRAGPRHNLVTALQNIGMSPEEAERFVPEPPRLQKTIYADGTDFNPDLKKFMDKFLACYGETGPQGDTARTAGGERIFTFVDKQGDTPRPKKFSECSVTQQEEFTEKAIAYFQTRKKFFEVDHITCINMYWADIPLPFMKCGEARMPDYYDDTKPKKNWYTPTEGDNNGLLWSQEHKQLKEMGAGGVKFTIIPGVTPIDENAPAEEKFRALLAAQKAQRIAADKHKGDLETANATTIKEWTASVQLMQERLKLINSGKTVVTGAYQAQGYDFLQVKDCRDPNCAQELTLSFKKQDDGSYKLIDWKNALWLEGRDKGGIFYSNLAWQKPAQGVVLTEQQFKDMVAGRLSPDMIVTPLDTFGKNKLSLQVVPVVRTGSMPSRAEMIVGELPRIQVTDSRDAANPVQYQFEGRIENGKYTVNKVTVGGVSTPVSGTVDNINDAKDWLKLVDRVRATPNNVSLNAPALPAGAPQLAAATPPPAFVNVSASELLGSPTTPAPLRDPQHERRARTQATDIA